MLWWDDELSVNARGLFDDLNEGWPRGGSFHCDEKFMLLDADC